MRNDGAKPSSFELVRFEPGKDIADVEQWFSGGLQGEAPATLFGGAEVAGGESLFLTEEFEVGSTYELVNPEAPARAKIPVD